MTVPLTQKINVSLKVRNFNSSLLKVNDSDGNPIEILSSRRLSSRRYGQKHCSMSTTTKILLRSKVKQRFAISLPSIPYDTFNDDDLTLRGNTNEVSEELAQELQERLAVAGVEVIETRLNHWRMPH